MAKDKEKKPNFFVRIGKRIAKWFRELKSELKKVVWPTPKQTVNNTAVVIVVCILVGAVIALFSLAASEGVSLLIHLVNPGAGVA